MWYVLSCEDRVDAGTLRADTRDEHLAYLKSFGENIILAGPLLDKAQNTPIGSLIIFQCESEEEVQDFQNNDPYAKAGLFYKTTCYPFRKTLPQTLA